LKILLLGFEYLDPEYLVEDDHLKSFNRVMHIGCYGVITPPDSSLEENKWIQLLTSQYSPSNNLKINLEKTQLPVVENANYGIFDNNLIWDAVISAERKAYILGELPFVIPQRNEVVYEQIEAENIHPVDNLPGNDHPSYLMSICRKKFERIRAIIKSGEWDFIYSFDSGLTQLQSMEQKIDIQPDSSLSTYYRNLDKLLGELIDLLTDDTILMLVSLRTNQSNDYLKEDIESNNDQPDYFMLAAANLLTRGELENIQIIDLSPSLLDLGGYDIPTSMEGKSFTSGKMVADARSSDLSEEEQAILRERLSGLGYF
jgi:hypothetical protein